MEKCGYAEHEWRASQVGSCVGVQCARCQEFISYDYMREWRDIFGPAWPGFTDKLLALSSEERACVAAVLSRNHNQGLAYRLEAAAEAERLAAKAAQERAAARKAEEARLAGIEREEREAYRSQKEWKEWLNHKAAQTEKRRRRAKEALEERHEDHLGYLRALAHHPSHPSSGLVLDDQRNYDNLVRMAGAYATRMIEERFSWDETYEMHDYIPISNAKLEQKLLKRYQAARSRDRRGNQPQQ